MLNSNKVSVLQIKKKIIFFNIQIDLNKIKNFSTTSNKCFKKNPKKLLSCIVGKQYFW